MGVPHAHTIEYRIGSHEELLKLHDQLKKHWLKEPAYYQGGQIVSQSEATDKEMKPRYLSRQNGANRDCHK